MKMRAGHLWMIQATILWLSDASLRMVLTVVVVWDCGMMGGGGPYSWSWSLKEAQS